MSTQALAPVTPQPDLVRRAEQIEAAANEFLCESEADYEMLGMMRDRAQSIGADAETTYRPRIDEANKLHKGLCADLNAVKHPADRAAAIFASKGIAFKQREAQAIAAANRQLELAATEENRKAEAERQRIQDELEAQRQAEIAKGQEAAKAEGASEAELVAIERHAPGVLVMPAPAPMPPALIQAPAAAKGAPKVNEKWTAEISNPEQFWKHAHANAIALGLLNSNAVIDAVNAKLARTASTMRSSMVIPGVRVWDEGTMRKGRK